MGYAANTDTKELKKVLFRQCEDVSRVMKSLSHPVRLKILCSTLGGEQSVSSLTDVCEISQSAMSQFLKRMKDEGLLASRREGTSIYYRIVDKKLLTLLKAVKDIYCS
jgi:ArsR family transcriptional regulator